MKFYYIAQLVCAQVLINDCFRTERFMYSFLFSWPLADLYEYLIASTIKESSRSSVSTIN